MIPSPWIAVVLALATYRLTRLIGWDDLPPVLRARQWATGEQVWNSGTGAAHQRLSNEVLVQTVTYRRPLLAHFIGCAFCQGFWNSCLVYAWWLLSPTSCLYAAAPFALSGAVGLIAKNWDP